MIDAPQTAAAPSPGVATPQVLSYVHRHALPLRLWVSPSLHALCERALLPTLDARARILTIPAPADTAPPEGPAVLLLALDALRGPQRDTLRSWTQRALPGRPIIQGEARTRETLLDAINTWHAFRVVPLDLPAPLLADTIYKAHEALAVELALSSCVGELRGEVARLSGALDELRATQARLVHGERLAALGQMTGMLMERVQHHFSSMEAFIAALGPLREAAQLGEIVDHATESTHAMQALLQDMLALAEQRSPALSLREELVDDLVQRAAAVFRRDVLARSRELEVDCGCGATVRVDRHRIYHVLLNLLRNAAQASPPREPLLLRTGSDVDKAWIEIEDHGCGIAPEALKQLFTPFFTTKGKDGTGLGLRMSRNAIERQGGTLTCTSAPGRGACFRVELPRHRDQAALASVHAQQEEPKSEPKPESEAKPSAPR
ncbi:MAG: HAMP domain-containing histidine kinase [Proteobacteria bacterium]|nr:HAMP domain-containing histidine kinase [Pseudomonadota bacterium]